VKKNNTLVLAMLTALLMTTGVSAAGTNSGNKAVLNTKTLASQSEAHKMPDDFKNMPLQEKKNLIIEKHTNRINNLLKEGKINEQEANKEKEKLTKEVQNWDGKTSLKYLHGNHRNKVKLPENFYKMSLQEKRDWMNKDFTERMNEKVKSGEISKSDADKKIENMRIKISSWDGNFNRKDKQ